MTVFSHYAGFVGSFGLVLSGCMMTPTHDGDPVCGADANVYFSGYTLGPNEPVTIEASADPDTGFSTIGQTTSSPTAFRFGDTDLYAWSVDAVVPTWASNSTELLGYVRSKVQVGSNIYNMVSFDDVNPNGQTPFACIVAEISAGSTAANAGLICASDDSPVATLHAPHISTCGCTPAPVIGDLIIDDASSAAAALCTLSVSGDLRIMDSAPDNVALPNLASIGGTAELHYEVPYQQSTFTLYRARTIDIPIVTSVGGDLIITGHRGPTSAKLLDVGLDTVTSVGGDIHIRTYDHNISGLGGLTSVPGSVLIEGWTGAAGNLDVSGFNTLPNLTTIGGNLTVQGFFATLSMFNSVTEVQGDLILRAVLLTAFPSFQNMATVGGDLVFWSMKGFGGTWPLLTTIDGNLVMRDQGSTTVLSAIQLPSAQAFGLQLTDNANLSTLDGTFQVGGGNIVISGNPMLSQCEVDTFLATQVAGGWSGNPIISDTIPCP